MKKWLLGGIIILIAVMAFIAVNQFTETQENIKVIAIATLMSHPALDAVQENTIKELERNGYIDGQNTRYIIRNASGQVQLAANIANELASQNPDVIVAITTPMAQAIAKFAQCPVVFAAVTDPVGAGLVTSLDKGEKMITGTSDAWPYEDQLKLIQKISPNVKKIGVIYNPGEAASQYGIKQIRKYAPGLGFELVEGAASSTGEVFPVAQNLANRVDAFFLSSDNTVIGGVAAAVKVAVEYKIPLYVGDSGTVSKGGVAAVSVGYSELGTETGKLAVRMLSGERYISTVVAKGTDVYINKKAAAMMNVKIPDEIIETATKVYEEID